MHHSHHTAGTPSMINSTPERRNNGPPCRHQPPLHLASSKEEHLATHTYNTGEERWGKTRTHLCILHPLQQRASSNTHTAKGKKDGEKLTVCLVKIACAAPRTHSCTGPVQRPATSLVRSPPGHNSGAPCLTTTLWRLLLPYAWLGRFNLESWRRGAM
jgi:hypothetical protein